MLRSMTAFARTTGETDWGTLTWEIRAVNHRYLEPNFRLPEQFRELETKIRESIKKRLNRGKLDITLKWQPSAGAQSGMQLNSELISQLNAALNQIASEVHGVTTPSAIDILQWPGVINVESADSKAISTVAMSAFEDALKALIEVREREGAQLVPLFEQRLKQISEIVSEVRSLLPGILARQGEVIKQRFEDAKVDLDEARVEQELVLLAQKSDVDEELDRLDAHVKEVSSVLAKDEPIGRRLDFLMQELNREANTLSSKSIVMDTTKAAVELKVLIEQMREQVQNVE